MNKSCFTVKSLWARERSDSASAIFTGNISSTAGDLFVLLALPLQTTRAPHSSLAQTFFMSLKFHGIGKFFEFKRLLLYQISRCKAVPIAGSSQKIFLIIFNVGSLNEFRTSQYGLRIVKVQCQNRCYFSAFSCFYGLTN